MIQTLQAYCRALNKPIVYALNRKEINNLLQKKEGMMCCVGILIISPLDETWHRILELRRMLTEQFQMLSMDFIPLAQSIFTSLRRPPLYEITTSSTTNNPDQEQTKKTTNKEHIRQDILKSELNLSQSQIIENVPNYPPLSDTSVNQHPNINTKVSDSQVVPQQQQSLRISWTGTPSWLLPSSKMPWE
ncbi:hypothetical protein RFI_04850 [Reticulomyxa filosa]|uniref:Uncharacterized protein n=1 Tax=Reticulomyxa filosa TaxID=46433 RepID=X6P217_RETFI|nr:hypothetical protein RFI_04850 [Reticulomyxa filosa]|eukprot:ETO32266.1 hypothetical protein RFI_04850 [Reticulomyxa filosa]